MWGSKRLAGVIPEVNLGECISHMSLPSVNKAGHSGFEPQRRPRNPEVQNSGMSSPTKRTCVLQKFLKKNPSVCLMFYIYSVKILVLDIAGYVILMTSGCCYLVSVFVN